MEQANLLSWICKGFYHHNEDLKILLSIYNPQIFSIQKSHLQNGQCLSLSSYNILTTKPASNTHAHGGVLLAIKDLIDFQKINLNTNL